MKTTPAMIKWLQAIAASTDEDFFYRPNRDSIVYRRLAGPKFNNTMRRKLEQFGLINSTNVAPPNAFYTTNRFFLTEKGRQAIADAANKETK